VQTVYSNKKIGYNNSIKVGTNKKRFEVPLNTDKIKIGIVGVGHMGSLHARVLSEVPDVELIGLADTDKTRAEKKAEEHKTKAYESVEELADNVQAAVISAPTERHLETARIFLDRGVATLVEKPLAADIQEAEKLVELADENNAVLQVGHTERFNPIIMALQSQPISAKFIECIRVSPFSFRSVDIGVVLDMMIHDIDIVRKLASSEVVKIDAVGVNVIGEHEDVANVRIGFENGCVANLTASRLALKTERKIRVFSEDAYLSLDYHKRYGIAIRKNPNLDLVRFVAEQRASGKILDPAQVNWSDLIKVEEITISDHEPLRKQAELFCRAARREIQPVVSGKDGLENVKLAHKILQAIRQHQWDGKPEGRIGLQGV
jgi:predicted dehydrogenase